MMASGHDDHFDTLRAGIGQCGEGFWKDTFLAVKQRPVEIKRNNAISHEQSIVSVGGSGKLSPCYLF